MCVRRTYLVAQSSLIQVAKFSKKEPVYCPPRGPAGLHVLDRGPLAIRHLQFAYGPVLDDHIKLCRILSNIIENGIKFTAEGGIVVSARLGLYVAKKFADLLGGAIQVESVLGKGPTSRWKLASVIRQKRRRLN
jgi:signal transduction histidine kinase